MFVSYSTSYSRMNEMFQMHHKKIFSDVSSHSLYEVCITFLVNTTFFNEIFGGLMIYKNSEKE